MCKSAAVVVTDNTTQQDAMQVATQDAVMLDATLQRATVLFRALVFSKAVAPPHFPKRRVDSQVQLFGPS